MLHVGHFLCRVSSLASRQAPQNKCMHLVITCDLNLCLHELHFNIFFCRVACRVKLFKNGRKNKSVVIDTDDLHMVIARMNEIRTVKSSLKLRSSATSAGSSPPRPLDPASFAL
jgi:hypothetical protein